MLRRAASLLLAFSLLAGCASQNAAGPSPALGPQTSEPGAQAEGKASQASAEDNKNIVQVAEEVEINAPIEQIWPVFDDPNSYWTILPMVKAVKPKGNADDGAMLVELEQGIAFVTGSYTAKIHKIRPHELELSIDHRFPSVLRDGRGVVEMKSVGEGKTHVAYRMTVDLGDSWALHLLKDRIRSALTRPPHLLKKHMEKN
ncbi:MAG: SRPBCC family protein [Polyangiaceae bacterium]|jgi:carbon monoxide dehydrogenase subunit G|nr:SRPBCC family protein [Polyangiaceae bacterium]